MNHQASNYRNDLGSALAHGVTFIKYCSILVQALTVQADEDFLYALFDLTKLKGAPWDETQEE